MGMFGKQWSKWDNGNIRIVVENSANISEEDVTEKDIKKIGRSASISDRGILDFFENRLRRDVISSFHRLFLHGASEYVEAAYSIGKWSIQRFRRVVSELRDPCTAYVPSGNLLYDLESLQWAITAEVAAAGEPEEPGAIPRDEDADREVWERYCVKVKGMAGSMSSLDDRRGGSSGSGSLSSLQTYRGEAVSHFRGKVLETYENLGYEELLKCIYLLPKFRIGANVFEMIVPIIDRNVPKDVLKTEVYPSLAVLIVCQANAAGAVAFIESLLALPDDVISENTVSSALEYCSHTQRSECARAIIDSGAHRITSEAIVAAMIPVCMRGADHYLAMMELFVMDKSLQAQIEAMPDDDGGPYSSGGGHGRSSKTEREKESKPEPVRGAGGETAEEFMSFVSLSSYLLLYLSSVSGYAKPATITELIEFYTDPCAIHLAEIVSELQHSQFVAQMFHSVCSLNLASIAWALVERGWMPTSVGAELRSAIVLGNQNIVHLLLESLLIPDEKLKHPYLPIIFRKSEAFSLLPMVAGRFPTEAAWFLEQLSCVPLPACVPKGRHAEPEVRSKPVHGIKLGTLSLHDALFHRKEAGGAAVHVWPRLKMNGQLRQAGSGKDDFETESVDCIGPEALLTENAVHEPLFGRTMLPSTSPFIRLLAEDDEQIILQPLMRALMEYHWSRGHFWIRFAIQFTVTAVYVACLAMLFINLVRYHNGRDEVDIAVLDALSIAVMVMALFFMIQELREFHDYPRKYLRSASNVIDTGIHCCAMYAVLGGYLGGVQITPIVMSLTLILCALRLIIHLRILPSVGPLVRLWVTASVNILPILIPMGVFALSFAGAFYLVEYKITVQEGVPSLHFDTLEQSLQTVLTMATADYSVLDYSTQPQVFVLRLLFHITFLIFLVNIIIALMTVNVADIHANTTAAWLLEIAGLMVELELFWPWPMRYPIDATSAKEAASISVGSKSRLHLRDHLSLNADSPDLLTVLVEKQTILYTWPYEYVTKSPWWNLISTLAVEQNDDDDGQALPNTWDTLLSKIGISFMKGKPAKPATPGSEVIKFDGLPDVMGDDEAPGKSSKDIKIPVEAVALQQHRASLSVASASSMAGAFKSNLTIGKKNVPMSAILQLASKPSTNKIAPILEDDSLSDLMNRESVKKADDTTELPRVDENQTESLKHEDPPTPVLNDRPPSIVRRRSSIGYKPPPDLMEEEFGPTSHQLMARRASLPGVITPKVENPTPPVQDLADPFADNTYPLPTYGVPSFSGITPATSSQMPPQGQSGLPTASNITTGGLVPTSSLSKAPSLLSSNMSTNTVGLPSRGTRRQSWLEQSTIGQMTAATAPPGSNFGSSVAMSSDERKLSSVASPTGPTGTAPRRSSLWSQVRVGGAPSSEDGNNMTSQATTSPAPGGASAGSGPVGTADSGVSATIGATGAAAAVGTVAMAEAVAATAVSVQAMAAQIDAIRDMMKGMERFMKVEGKMNRDRIKRLEEFLNIDQRGGGSGNADGGEQKVTTEETKKSRS
ncbi:hypothetical protein HDU76_013970 [Blyttiomyces sp. JEL0837]|nr:hypothetical protein HDU76_013970 [Blyttiomyces sp. JEL0837]